MGDSKTDAKNIPLSPTVATDPAPAGPSPLQNGPASTPARIGRVETLSTEFVIGWASVTAANAFSHVFAMLGTEVVGFGVANISRPDLDRARAENRLNAYGFLIVFGRPVPADSVPAIDVFVVGQTAALAPSKPI